MKQQIAPLGNSISYSINYNKELVFLKTYLSTEICPLTRRYLFFCFPHGVPLKCSTNAEKWDQGKPKVLAGYYYPPKSVTQPHSGGRQWDIYIDIYRGSYRQIKSRLLLHHKLHIRREKYLQTGTETAEVLTCLWANI